MPWFRFRRKKEDEQAERDAAVATLEAAPAPIEDELAEAGAQDDAASSDGEAARKRRRGSRGGRGRKKPAGSSGEGAGDDQTEVAAKPAAKPSQKAKPETERSNRRERQRGGAKDRRRQVPRRAPLPTAKRELLITVDVGEQRVALLEDDKVAEVYLERPERRSIAGNIYLGTVDNVLPGMEAAFVEIGLEKNGFLYVDEIIVPELEGTRHGRKITDLIQRGQQILVQAVKDPMKTKGARLTTEISLPGRFLVYVPNGEGLGVSRRLEDAERQRLKEILKDIAPASGGVIVRTAAEGASAEDVERDLVFLERLWKTIQARAKTASAPELVYQEAELPLRIVRDLFAGDFVAAHVDSDRTYKRIVGYLKKTSPHMVERVHRTKDKEPLFERHGVEKEIASTIDRRVDLPSGGYLIFDYAEAFTVIDVNTGRFVGSRSKTSTQRLEDTAVKNNLEAVKEVVRQLRLRDIGGIIVIDFIDMANPKNRQAVEETLRTELERDRTKTFVVEISPLGLVEMTRQNVTDGPREVMTRRCPTCAGDGIVVSDATVALEVERKLRTLAAGGAGSRIQAYKVAVHPKTLSLLAGPGGARLAALEDATRRRFYLVEAAGHAHVDHFEVLAEGRRDDLAAKAAAEEGAELEVKLVEIDLHDGAAAVGKLDGLDVVVAGAAKLVGKKAKVLVGRVLEGQVFATLVSGQAAAAPISFESEAEKPTRAPARKRAGEQPEDAAATPELGEAGEFEETAEPEDEPTAEAETETEIGIDGQPTTPRKRTRRGSRGGKRRKKPTEGAADETVVETDDGEADLTELEPVEAAAEVAPEEAESAPPASRPRTRRAPRIHVPDGAPKATSAPESEAEATEVTESNGDLEASGEEPGEESGDGTPTTDGPPKKRTRRGTRGGRNRKRKPAAQNGDGIDAAEADDAEVGEHEAVATEATDEREETPEAPTADDRPEAPAETEEYVPMSEWIGDFDRR